MALLAFACFFVLVLPALVVRFAAVRRGPQRPMVALTIDDGPSPSTTPALIQALAQAGIPATFFCIGEKFERYPQLGGHELQNHTYSHPAHLAFWPSRLAQRELERAQHVFPTPPIYFRAVAGVLSPPLYWAARRLGLTCVHWTATARDGGPLAVSTPLAIRRLAKGLVPGGILVVHDRAETAALIAPLKQLADERGLTFVPLSVLLARENQSMTAS